MVEMFADWSEDDIRAFADLFGRYVTGVLGRRTETE
jgi:hypothetical protein